jgi:hypothetical protein
VFSPFTVPFYVLSLWKALAVAAMLKLFVAALGTYLLGRALGMRFAGALLAGVVFAFGTFFVAWLGWPLVNVAALLPWLLLLSELVVRRPEALSAAGLAAVVALTFFGGHPETTFHAMVAAVVFFTLRLLLAWRRAGRERKALVRPVLTFGLGLAVGTAIAGVLLVPMVEFLLHSADYSRRLQRPPGHADAHYLGAFFLSDYWGRPTQTSLAANIVSNRGFYAGGITLMLAAVALVLRPTAVRLGFAASGALALAVVLGVDPVFSIVTAVPGFRTAHNGRLVFIVLLALAMLAGWGLDELGRLEPRKPPRSRLAVAAAAGIFCVPIAWMLVAGAISPGKLGPALKVAWGFADPPRPTAAPLGAGDALRVGGVPTQATAEIIHLSALLQWLPLAGGALALLTIALGGLGSRVRRAVPGAVVAALAIAILVLDLFRANMGFNTAIPIKHAQQPTTPALRYLQSRAPNRFAGFSQLGIGQPLQPNLSMRYGLYDARGYDYPVERRFDSFWRATAALPGDLIQAEQRAAATRRGLRGMSLLSVTDIMQFPNEPALHLPGLHLAYSGADARVYRNTEALPRVFLVSHQRRLSGGRAALRATVDPRFDARRIAVTERQIPGLQAGGGTSRRSAGTARLVSYRSKRIVAAARSRSRSLLVLTDVYYPGWKATLDGRPARIERVDYLFRGVVLPPGRHRVEFRYEPMSWRIGSIVSGVGVAAVAGLALVGWRRRRGARPHRRQRRAPPRSPTAGS